MKYKEALKIVSEYVYVDLDELNDNIDLLFSRQCGKSENTLEKIYYRLWLFMKAQFVIKRYRKDRVSSYKNKKGWKI